MRRALIWSMVASGLIGGSLVAARSARDSLFLSTFPTSALPLVMIASAALGIMTALAVSRWIVRFGPARVVPAALLLNALLFLVEVSALRGAPRAAAALLYLHVTVLGPVLLSGFWTVFNERFDPFTAKRGIARMAAAAALAGVMFGFLGERVASLVGIEWGLALLALLALASTAALHRVGVPEHTTLSVAVGDASSFQQLRGNPLLLQMTALMLLGAAVDTWVDYALKAEAARSWPETQQLLRFFTGFYVTCGLLSFGLQAAVGRRVLMRFGLAGSLVTHPVGVGIASAVAIFFPRLATVALARGAELILANSLFRAGFELLYTPIPQAVKRPLKAWIDVAARSVGSVVGAGCLAVLVFLVPDLPNSVVLTLAALGSLAALLTVLRIHRAYVEQLGDSLRTGRVALEEEEVVDATTARTFADADVSFDRRALLEQIRAHRREELKTETTGVPAERLAPETAVSARRTELGLASRLILDRVTDLCSDDPQRVRHALHARSSGSVVRSAALERRLVPHVTALLDRPELARDAQDFLHRVGPRNLGLLVDTLLDPEEPPAVRLGLARLLGRFVDRRALAGLWLALDDNNRSFRQACADASVRIVERDRDLVPAKNAVLARIDRALAEAHPNSREQGADLELVFTLLAVLHGRETLASTRAGLNSGNASLRGTALEFLESVLPPRTRDVLFERLGVKSKPAPKADRTSPTTVSKAP